jgi:DNA-directed RNA polymerase beta' subunit
MQVGVPMHVASVLTFPERVTHINLARLQKRVLNGTPTLLLFLIFELPWNARMHAAPLPHNLAACVADPLHTTSL